MLDPQAKVALEARAHASAAAPRQPLANLETPRTADMDIALTSTDLILPISESRGDIWLLDQIDR